MKIAKFQVIEYAAFSTSGTIQVLSPGHLLVFLEAVFHETPWENVHGLLT